MSDDETAEIPVVPERVSEETVVHDSVGQETVVQRTVSPDEVDQPTVTQSRIPAEQSTTVMSEQPTAVVEDRNKYIHTAVGDMTLDSSLGCKSFAFFTPYGKNEAYSNPRSLQEMSKKMYEMGFQVNVGKPPIVVWNEEFKKSDEYQSLNEDKIKHRLAEAARSMPSMGKFGRVDSMVEHYKLPRDYARAMLNSFTPRIVMVQYDGVSVASAYAIEYYENSEYLEDVAEPFTLTNKGIKVRAFTNLNCFTTKSYRALCDKVLGKSWDESVDILLKMNEVESSLLLGDSRDEIELD